jgi:PIN like domain
VRRLLVDLGYVVHTPAELFGTREAALGASDELWLEKVAKTGWAVLNRDTNIMRRRDELAAYRRAGVHMLALLPWVWMSGVWYGRVPAGWGARA